jgi:hypothetical protein
MNTKLKNTLKKELKGKKFILLEEVVEKYFPNDTVLTLIVDKEHVTMIKEFVKNLRSFKSKNTRIGRLNESCP